MKIRHPASRRLRCEWLEARLTLSAVPSLQALAVTSIGHATPVSTSSSNWSGYAVASGTNSVSAVVGSWKVPVVTGSGTAYSSAWVGIDGLNSSTVEQIGTDSDIVNGTAQYYAWYEMYPKGSVDIASMTIKPGDTLSASVTYVSGSLFQLTITDGSQTFTTTQSARGAAKSSAEWIVEAPSSYAGVLPLANFGAVSFANSSATINGVNGPVDNGWAGTQLDRINMASYGTSEDSTGGLTDTAGTTATSSFTVTYNTANPTTPTQPQHHGWGWGSSGWRQPNVPPRPAVAHSFESGHEVRDRLFASLETFVLEGLWA